MSARIGTPKRLLDVGWTMSPPEWLGVLLAVRRAGTHVTGIDIVEPSRVKSRFLPEMREELLGVPVIVGDVREYESSDESYDLITCVSTLEHIGFDQATEPEVSDTVFVRSNLVDEVPVGRSSTVDKEFLDSVFRNLSRGGRLLLTVPAGADRAILHQDSLGLYTRQYEYGMASWKTILEDSRFSVSDEAYFVWDSNVGWQQASGISDLTHHTSELMAFAVGCACAELIRI